MVGIVVVSHSARLAEGIVELASQMVQTQVPVAVAGGIDDPEHPIGTDAMRVLAAIEAVYSPDGVLVLMDLGSALLSAELAVEMLPPEKQERVALCAAPLVEGTLAAVVQASVGGSLATVRREAEAALQAKRAQLGEYGQEEVVEGKTAVSPEPSVSQSVVIRNRLGLHARPAAQFVQTATKFAAEIFVQKGEQTANAKSINQVATLGVRQGEEVVICASGPDAETAVAALVALVAANFGESMADIAGEEEETAARPRSQPHSDHMPLQGVPASPGIAFAPAVRYQPRLPSVPRYHVENPAAEWQRLETAVMTARHEIETLFTQARQQFGEANAAIFEAHLLFLQDPDWLEAARTRIFAEKTNAEAAWQHVVEQTASRFHKLDDPYLRARANDVKDVGERVLRHLMAVELPPLTFDQPVILLAVELTPSDTARLDPENVQGICTELGGATSHTAILARSLGIPAVAGVQGVMAQVQDGDLVGLDGTTGEVWIRPQETAVAELRTRQARWDTTRKKILTIAHKPAVTKDDRRIEVAANIGGTHDAAVALEYGAEAIGLFRTEFLFLGRDEPPDEEEQTAVYRQIAQTMKQRPIIIRTLDIGGDKPLPYLTTPAEQNPFLGQRGIRFCLAHPDLFLTQLRAILRANTEQNIKLMFPMISTLDELLAAKKLLLQAKEELLQANIIVSPNLEIGIMIEVPAAVTIADQLAQHVHFFSIGTNDLTQYIMAADRGNAQVSQLVDPLHPAVLRHINATVKAAHKQGIWVGMCGELAGDPLATAVLVGLGLDELSMNAPAIPIVKQLIRHLTYSATRRLANRLLKMNSAASVRTTLQKWQAKHLPDTPVTR
ncbi:MAG: phosphoenolpyruvate--protein phosphotransferase [Chloroflexi bacterium]|nr:MAG: phosphoenolpyruvate--protein phosphotransferase [Chloroflexota bacterium]